jgi:hypothetical protein
MTLRHDLTRYAGSALVLCALASTLSSCATPKPTLPEPGTPPAGVTFQGVWFSEQFDHMYLRVSGDSVRGIYTYKYGGTMEGEVEGDMLVFRWIDPGDQDEARRGHEGRGYLKIVEGEYGPALRGKWGYGEDYVGGGIWNAEFVREIENDDPRDLEQWRARGVR